MPRSALVSAVRAVDWCQLRSTYESGEIVRDIVLGLASRDETEVKWAWQQVNETVLQHQGTVYPATAAAAPFLCQIALDEASLWRAALTAERAFLSAGHDEPHAPAGTALAVRDAVRPYVGPLLRLWGTATPGLDMALVAVSAFPPKRRPSQRNCAMLSVPFSCSTADRRRNVGAGAGLGPQSRRCRARLRRPSGPSGHGWETRPRRVDDRRRDADRMACSATPVPT